MKRGTIIGLAAITVSVLIFGSQVFFSDASGPDVFAAQIEQEQGISAGGAGVAPASHEQAEVDYWPLLFVLLLSTFIGIGVIARVSRLLHTPLMSLTNAISAIAVVGSIIVTGSDYPEGIRIIGAIALFASMTNIVSGFMITDRMLKMFKQDKGPQQGAKP